MCKKLLVSALVLLLSLTGIAYAKNMYIWRDPSLNFSDLKKILVAPAKAILNAGTQMRPTGKVQKDLNYQSIGEWYDLDKTVSENYNFAKLNGIKVGLTTLKKFCKE